jgi:hypothetical protein
VEGQLIRMSGAITQPSTPQAAQLSVVMMVVLLL